MKAIRTPLRPISVFGFRAAIHRLASATVCLMLTACGGSADAPPPPESAPVTPTGVAPGVTLQPVDATVQAPATATFMAAASGVPAPTVQWGQSTDAGVTWADVAGATSPNFTTAATALADSGKLFRAVFTNVSGSATSNAATLTVTATGPVTVNLNQPHDVAIDAAGNLYIADTFNRVIRKVTPAGVGSTLAGTVGANGDVNGTGSAARFNLPLAIAVDSAGTVYVGDQGHAICPSIREITPAGVVTTLAGGSPSPCTAGVNGTGTAAALIFPVSVKVDSSGTVYVAESNGNDIRQITPAGVVTTLAGNPSVAGSTDGTGSAATFHDPEGIALDSAGNVYVVDSLNEKIRVVTPAGVVTSLAGMQGSFGSADGTGAAARFHNPIGIAVDAAGTVYVGDQANQTIRKITPAGVVTTLAGTVNVAGNADGPCVSALFSSPQGLAVDAAGNLYVADAGNNSIRKITPACVVSTVVR
jgi:sugar lactone lactonase YvrE